MADRRPRILIVVTLAEIGGAQTYVMRLVPALTDRFDVVVAAWGPGPLRAAVEAAGAHYVPLEHVRRPVSPLHDVLGVLELMKLCRRFRPDIVHTNSSKAGILGRLAAVLAGVRVRVFTVHGWAFAQHHGLASRVYLWLDRLVRPLTSAFVCVSEQTRSEGLAAGTCTASRTVVIANAVDVDATARAPLVGDPPRVVVVGRFKEPKDFVTLVHALARCNVPYRAVMAGDGPDRAAIEAAIRETSTGDRIELLGERDDIPELLAGSDVFVLSSRSEGMPMSVLEAMAAGLPIVASAVGGIPELVEEGRTGTLVPPADVPALAAALERVLGDAELRRSLGAAARERAEERFALRSFHAAHIELYDRLLARR